MTNSIAPEVKEALPRYSRRYPMQDALTFRSEPLDFMRGMSGAYGPIAEFRLGPLRALMLSGPEVMREVLVTRAADFDKGRLQRKALTPVLGNGLLISEGDLHDRQRKLISPLLTARKINAHADVISRVIERHITDWGGRREFDLLDSLRGITHDVISHLLTGGPVEYDGPERMSDRISRVLDWEMRRLLNPLALPLWFPTPGNRRVQADLAELRQRIQSALDANRGNEARGNDLLGAMLEARLDGEGIAPAQIIDEGISVWGGAYETSADAQFWTALELQRNPAVADLVREEVLRVTSGARPTAHHLAQMPYTLQVFKESLRKYPPAAMMLRQARRDTSLGGYQVRRGTLVFLSVYAMHRSERYWPDPDQFDPSRFDPEAGRNGVRKDSYLPFGIGEHSCPGSSLAYLEGQIFTALSVSRGRLELDDERSVVPELVINLRPRGVVPAKFEPIHATGATSKVESE